MAVARISEAKVGDTVWFFDSQMNRYEDGKYKGRGVWKEVVIEAETRSSFIVGREKYDKKTGVVRGTRDYSASLFLFGEKDKDDREWRQRSDRIGERVQRCDDIEKLKQIAAIIGWSP